MNDPENIAETPSPAELEKQELISLKKTADTMKLKYHPNIGLDKLRERVNEQLNKPAEEVVKEKAAPIAAVPPVKYTDSLPDSPQVAAVNRRSKGKPESPVERKIRLRH